MRTRLRTVVHALLLLCVSSPALAQRAEDFRERTSIGVLGGYGLDLENSQLNMFGGGIGLRGGYTFKPGFYLGGQLLYFFGESDVLLDSEVSLNLVTLGVEAGYDAIVEPFILRPSLGLGLGFVNNTSMELGGRDLGDDSSTELYLAPGTSLLYPIDAFFAGVDGRFIILLADSTFTAVTLMATVGFNF